MKPFSSYYKNFSKEKFKQIDRGSLDPNVWEFPETTLPILHPIIKTQILQDVNSINKMVSVRDYYLVGKILTKNYMPDSSIEIYVQLDDQQVDEMTIESVNVLLKLLNGRMAAGTTHPIYYFVTQSEETKDKFPMSYDIENEKWNRDKKYLNESIVDYPQDNLDPLVWDIDKNPPKIKEDVKEKIMKSLKEYFSENFFKNYIEQINITGSIGTKQWKPTTDIDIHIIPKQIDKYKAHYEQLRSKVKKHFNTNKILIGQHPLEVYIQIEPEQETRGDASYNINKDKWEKLPFNLSDDFDPDVEFAYLKKDMTKIFSSMDSALGELRRDLIDYNLIEDYLSNLKTPERKWLKDKLYSKLDEIENDINNLVNQKDKYHQARREAYTQDDMEEAWNDLIKSKSWAPGNIIWKMLDKYKYISLIVKLQDIVGDDDNELEPEDIKDIEDAINFKEYHEYSNTEDILEEKRRKFTPFFKKHKKGWEDPLKSFRHASARGITRKRLSYVPHIHLAGKTLPTAQSVLDTAKEAENGIWRITRRQALEIASKYHIKIPTAYTYRNWRKLGKTGIAIWYHTQTNRYYLVKKEGITKKKRKMRPYEMQ